MRRDTKHPQLRSPIRNLVRLLFRMSPEVCAPNQSAGESAVQPVLGGHGSEKQDTRLLLPVQPSDHMLGTDSAPITLMEYGDYQCPQCGVVYFEIKDLLTILGDRVRFVFRQYPYAKLHPQAELAAEAAEAAGAQGRFWEMHDLLFQHQNALREKHLLGYATLLGLDMERFRCDLKTGVYRERVRRDFQSGVRNGVYATPCIFINGVRHNGAFDLNELLEVVSRHAPQIDLMASRLES
jgi:protein-disulfide isomerase